MVGFEGGVNLGPVKADNNRAGDVNYGDAALLGFVGGFHGRGRVFLDVLISVFDA